MLDPMLPGPVATVDLDALGHNLERVRGYLAPGTRVLAAVKANAYGHGAVPVARQLERLGVAHFGVATPQEALELREGGVEGTVLCFSPVLERSLVRRLAEANVALTVADHASLDALRAADAPEVLRLHLKVDTGMGRLGLEWADAAGLAVAVERETRMALAGVWTHFARSDEADRSATLEQIEAFEAFLEALRRHGITPPLRHAANSGGIIAFPDSHYDMVRPGIALYGYHSSDVVGMLERELRPVMTLQAPVTFVKRVKAGRTVSYGGAWRARGPATVATVRIGYADGYPRQLSRRGQVHLVGATLPLAGGVCMDQIMVDAGDLDVLPGDVATLWGPPGPDAETLAREAGTISYELLVRVSPRVERRYTASSTATRPGSGGSGSGGRSRLRR